MKVSIIFPIYNVEQYLLQSVNSIRQQTYKNIEIILVDDGSKDTSPILCEQLKKQDERIVVIHKENGGLSDARNAGLKISTGDYVCFLDSDDYWDDDKALALLMGKIEKTGAEIVQFHRKWFDEKHNLVSIKKFHDYSQIEQKNSEEIIKQMVRWGEINVHACLSVISRKFLIDNGLFFKQGIKSEDIEWGMRVFACNPKIAFVNEAFYVYRVKRDGSITSNIDYRHLCDLCETIKNIVKMLETQNTPVSQSLLSYMMYQCLITSALLHRSRLTKTERLDIQNKVREICKNRLLKYRDDPIVNKVSLLYRCIGFQGMSYILGFYLVHRRKRRNEKFISN